MPNIAFISTAHIHVKGFLENLAKRTDGGKAYAIWDDVEDRGRRYAADYGATFVPNLDALLADPGVNGFIIAAENTRHMPLFEKVLPVGKPIFCDKPLLTTVAEMRKLSRLLKNSTAPLHSGYWMPFKGDMRAVAALIKAGTLGKITRVRCRNAHHAAYGRWFDNPDLAWFADPSLAGGGAFMDMGTHAVHLLRTLFGSVDEVWATIGNHSQIYPQVDDYGIAHLKFSSGILGTVEAAWTQTGGSKGLEITGSEATLWDDGKGYFWAAPGKDPTRIEPLPSHPISTDRLVETILGRVTQEELDSDLEASIDAVCIMEAAYLASRSGGWMKVERVL